jgi:hypothetical protein
MSWEQPAVARIAKCSTICRQNKQTSENKLFSKNNSGSIQHRRTAFVARGALWGSEDIFRMRESIAEMHITMRKHPSHLKLHSDLASKMPKDTHGIRKGEVLICQNSRSCKLKFSRTFSYSEITNGLTLASKVTNILEFQAKSAKRSFVSKYILFRL